MSNQCSSIMHLFSCCIECTQVRELERRVAALSRTAEHASEGVRALTQASTPTPFLCVAVLCWHTYT